MILNMVSNRSGGGSGIEQLRDSIAPSEDTGTASQAYTVDDYMYILGDLYVVAQDIPQGDSIVIGTNVQPATIGSNLARVDNELTIINDWLINFEDCLGTVEADGESTANAYTMNMCMVVEVSGSEVYFCKANTDIDPGDTIEIGTNVDITTVADELFRLNSLVYDILNDPALLGLFDVPPSDGTYVFTCEVVDGEPVYYWV